jgi:hypothetical protein
MHDVGGPAVARLFYEQLLVGAEINTSAVAHAVDHAVVELWKGGVLPERWATFVHMRTS